MASLHHLFADVNWAIAALAFQHTEPPAVQTCPGALYDLSSLLAIPMASLCPTTSPLPALQAEQDYLRLCDPHTEGILPSPANCPALRSSKRARTANFQFSPGEEGLLAPSLLALGNSESIDPPSVPLASLPQVSLAQVALRSHSPSGAAWGCPPAAEGLPCSVPLATDHTTLATRQAPLAHVPRERLVELILMLQQERALRAHQEEEVERRRQQQQQQQQLQLLRQQHARQVALQTLLQVQKRAQENTTLKRSDQSAVTDPHSCTNAEHGLPFGLGMLLSVLSTKAHQAGSNPSACHQRQEQVKEELRQLRHIQNLIWDLHCVQVQSTSPADCTALVNEPAPSACSGTGPEKKGKKRQHSLTVDEVNSTLVDLGSV